jgi:SAM-dependent methyltransferase
VRVDANGSRFWFDVEGSALVPEGPAMRERPTVLLLHGGPGSFDKVSSALGIMFAPDHEAVASELARVIPPGGKLALANWTPTGGLGRMFKVMAPYQPAPPPSSPFDWGDEPRVRELLGDDFELEIDEHVSTMRVPSGEDYWQLFSTSYGPTKTLAEAIGERREELHRDWVEFFETNYSSNGEIVHTREYLLVLGIRR